jgi:NAD(P) transhydrogenase subunit alpha
MANLPSQVSSDASQMYSSNLYNLVSEYWDEENKTFNLDLEDDILKGCVITHDGGLVNEAIKNIRGS